MTRPRVSSVALPLLLVVAGLAPTASAVRAAGSADSDTKTDPLGALDEAQRERFLAENADGSMTLEWTPTEYDLAVSKALAGQQEGAVTELPNPLDFPQVVDPRLKPPGADAITFPPHTPTAPGEGKASVSGFAGASDYQSDHVSYSNLGAIVRIDYALLLNPTTPTTGDCNGSNPACFWFNAADGWNADGYYLHWGPQHGSSANGASGTGWKLALSGYVPGGTFFGGLATAGSATVTTNVWHVISLRMVQTTQFAGGGWISRWAIFLDGVEKGSVWIGGLFLDIGTGFWQEVYETNGPCTTQRAASLFDNVTYNRLFDPVTYSVSSGTVSYDTSCSNTNFQSGYGAAVDLRQTTRTVSDFSVISF